MEDAPEFRAGFAEVEYTPEPGLTLLGQMHERVAEGARDPLMACAAAFRSGVETVVLVTADICFLSAEFVGETRRRFAERTGMPPDRLLLHATHTHDAPTVADLLSATADAGFVERLRSALLEAAEGALARLEPVRVYSGCGHMGQMGWNRRAMFADGSSAMYGHSDAPGFIGMEGPRDPALGVLFVRNARGEIPGVIVNFSTHPNAIENATVYSADIPGAARGALKGLLGPGTVALYLTGAAGNTAPSMLDPHVPEQPWRGEEGLERSGLYLAGEAAKVIAAATEPEEAPALRLERTALSLPIRPWPEPGDPTCPDGWDGPARAYYEGARADWPRRMREESPVDVSLSVVRIGGAAICANPAELFVEFGLEIRRTSPARMTMVCELTDGCVGYVPTPKAFARGGYETWPAPTSQLQPDAGDKIVIETQRLLRRAFTD